MPSRDGAAVWQNRPRPFTAVESVTSRCIGAPGHDRALAGDLPWCRAPIEPTQLPLARRGVAAHARDVEVDAPRRS